MRKERPNIGVPYRRIFFSVRPFVAGRIVVLPPFFPPAMSSVSSPVQFSRSMSETANGSNNEPASPFEIAERRLAETASRSRRSHSKASSESTANELFGLKCGFSARYAKTFASLPGETQALALDTEASNEQFKIRCATVATSYPRL